MKTHLKEKTFKTFAMMSLNTQRKELYVPSALIRAKMMNCGSDAEVAGVGHIKNVLVLMIQLPMFVPFV